MRWRRTQPGVASADSLDNTISTENHITNNQSECIPKIDEQQEVNDFFPGDHENAGDYETFLEATADDLREATEHAKTLQLDQVRDMMEEMFRVHQHDPNFPTSVLQGIDVFLHDPDVMAHTEKKSHRDMIWKMFLQAALYTTNSPYSAVRAVVDNTDDPTMPCSTIRAWVLGLSLGMAIVVINQFLSLRYPSYMIWSTVAQFVSFPLGRIWDRAVPDWGVTLFGTRHSLTPCRFNMKEHLMVTVIAMGCTTGNWATSTIAVQYLYYNMSWATNYAYIFMLGLSQSWIGIGLIGLLRPILVYPAHCIWFPQLATYAMNKALHSDDNPAVDGPFKAIYSMSRYRLLLWAMLAIFIWTWVPQFLFTSLQFFSWMSWIAPANVDLNIWTGMKMGLGLLNPWPTFDWYIIGSGPLITPSFSTINITVSAWFWYLATGIIYYANFWNTAFLPINTISLYTHNATDWLVSQVIDEKGQFHNDKYMAYSAPFMTAGLIMSQVARFLAPTVVLSYAILFHRYEIVSGFKSAWRSFRRPESERKHQDVHARLMAVYPEVPGWFYFAILAISIAFGIGALSGWPTGVNGPAVVFLALALSITFVVPIGILLASTSYSLLTGDLAPLLGGLIYPGNAMAVNFFTIFTDALLADTMNFAMLLKLGHYGKLPPRFTVAAQLIGKLFGLAVASGVFRWQMGLPNVCTPDAPFQYLCLNVQSTTITSTLFGTLGATKVFGPGSPYGLMVIGFAVGAILPVLYYGLIKLYPRTGWLRQVHPALFVSGPSGYKGWSFFLPHIYVALVSWQWLRKRYLGFWSKYNYTFAVAVDLGTTLCVMTVFAAVGWQPLELRWWGNDIPNAGCENAGQPCTLKQLGADERLWGWWDGNTLPIPGQ